MNFEQLVMQLPAQTGRTESAAELTVHHWGSLAEEFAAQGGRELLLAGAEPLDYPGFWPVVRRGRRAGTPRVTAYLSGSLLEPRVCRELVESGIHLLVALDSISPEAHELLHGAGSHGRAMAAIDRFVKDGVGHRIGILATASGLNQKDLPLLGAWAAGRGIARLLWNAVPDGGWPSAQLETLRLSPEAKTSLYEQMRAVARSVNTEFYIGPVDPTDEPTATPGYSRVIRVRPDGGAFRGFNGEGGYLGSVKRSRLHELPGNSSLAAG
ncbi:MAG: radical SAM protein [Mycobacterium leprae]